MRSRRVLDGGFGACRVRVYGRSTVGLGNWDLRFMRLGVLGPRFRVWGLRLQVKGSGAEMQIHDVGSFNVVSSSWLGAGGWSIRWERHQICHAEAACSQVSFKAKSPKPYN